MKTKAKIDKNLINPGKSIILDDKRRESNELRIGVRALFFQNKENEKRAAELIIAYKELAFQKEEKEKQAAELHISNRDLKETELFLKEHIQGLEEMMFMVSHKVRQPITHIIGISYLLDKSIISVDELKQSVEYIKQSVLSLDSFTKELTTFMITLDQKKCYFYKKNGPNLNEVYPINEV